MKDNWIKCEDQEPELYQRIMFVVESCDKVYNGKVYGGTYQGKYKWQDKLYFNAACPGISWKITHWQPLPEPPTDKPNT
jgi:hypothetical protein